MGTSGLENRRRASAWGFDSSALRMTKLAFSVTLDDCDVQTFRSGGKGGQHQNKTESGVRVIHRDSGARGESREHKSQLQNKRAAFKRMVEHPKFKVYINAMLYGQGRAEREVEEMMARKRDFRTEVKVNGKWVVVEED